MQVPYYVFQMPWFRELTHYAKLVFFDTLRAVHAQYQGEDVDLKESRGLNITHDRSRIDLSPNLFRKGVNDLVVCGILTRVENVKRTGKFKRGAFYFRLPD